MALIEADRGEIVLSQSQFLPLNSQILAKGVTQNRGENKK